MGGSERGGRAGGEGAVATLAELSKTDRSQRRWSGNSFLAHGFASRDTYVI